MKKAITLLLLTFIVCITYAQQYTPMTAAGYQMKRLKVDSTLHLPSFCGIPTLLNSTAKQGALAIDTCNDILYLWTNLSGWTPITGGSGATPDLQAVTDVGATTTNTIIIDDALVTHLELAKHDIAYTVIKPLEYTGAFDTNFEIQDTLANANCPTIHSYIDGASNQSYKIGYNGINNTPYIDFISAVNNNLRITNNSLYFSNGGGESNNLLFLMNGYNDITYYPVGNSVTDTIATLADVRNSGGVTSVAALTLGTSGTDLSSTVANYTTTPVITLNVPTASALNRGALLAADWTTFNNKQNALTNPVTGTGTNNEIAYFNSSGSTVASLTTSTYPSLTELAYVKGVTSDIQTQINSKGTGTVTSVSVTTANGVSGSVASATTTPAITLTLGAITPTSTNGVSAATMAFVDPTSSIQTQINAKATLSQAAYTILANNTSGTANMTTQTFREPGEAAYTGTATWTGGTAPSGTTNHRFRWSQIGKTVTLSIVLNYTTAGTSNTAVTMTLPTDCPSPSNWSGFAAANDIISSSWGFIGTNTSTANTGRAILTNNSTNTGYQIVISSSSTASKTAGFTINYFAQ